jgi:heme/copper-type cytochrome/quinol oxidase subunit 2
LLAFSKAFDETFGLLMTFGGIGIVVNVLIVYIVVQVRGEHQRNEEYRAERQRRTG